MVRTAIRHPFDLETIGSYWESREKIGTVFPGCVNAGQACTESIERLQLADGQSQAIDVVFLDPAAFTSTRMAQRYSRIGEKPRKYRYESRDTSFTADLPVDDDGLLLEYPGFFRRMW